jgi:enoyl-CoA hydratase
MSEEVLVEQSGTTLLVTINRAAARNAIDAAVIRGIVAALGELDARTDLSIGVLTGAGGTFCAGMDLKAFLRGEDVTLPGRGLAGMMEASPRKPMIAAVEGYALAGDFFSAADAHRYELVNHVTKPGDALPCTLRLAERITANAPLAIATTKEIIVRSADWTSDEAFARQAEIMKPVFASADAREGAQAFAQKRTPAWHGE